MTIGKNSTASTGQYYIDFLTSIHGNNPFEIRIVPNFNYRGLGTTSLLRNGDYIHRAKRDKENEIETKGKWCKFNADEFGRALRESFLDVSSYGDGCSVLFTVNSPNFDLMDKCVTKDEHIQNGGKINAQFIDIDAPKDIRSNKVELMKFKQNLKQRLLQFHIEPSGVSETKHGYHVFWLVSDGTTDLFRHVQMQLIQELEGDENCINESRLLRLPYFMHEKDPREPYPVTIKKWNSQIVYSQKYLKDNLPELAEDTLKKVLKQKSDSSQVSQLSDQRKENVLELVLEKLNARSENERKIITHCCMPNHRDNTPSAWINKEFMFYHCQVCGVHLSIEELARELEWSDVLAEIIRYDIDLNEELDRIKNKAKCITEIVQNSNESEQQLIENISKTVIDDFNNAYNQQMNERHVQYIRDITKLLVKAPEQEKAVIVPLEMGGGKTSLIKVFLQQMLQRQNDFGAVVVVDRIEDAKKLAEEINEYFSSDHYAYAMYGFDEMDCLDNIQGKARHSVCPMFTSNFKYNCRHVKECRYFNQEKLQKKFPVLIITKKRVNLNFDKLERYKCFGENDSMKRNILIFDEKPSIVSIKELALKQFQKYNDTVQNKLEKLENPAILNEFNHAVARVKKLFDKAEKRRLFKVVDKDFRFSEAFLTEYRKHFSDFTKLISEYPQILECIFRNGGHSEVTRTSIKLITNAYHNYSEINGFKTLIFDGTADMDLEYNHDKFNTLSLKPIRTYEGLEINICKTVKATKTSLSDSEKIKAFCDDVALICREYPNSKIYIPTFKDIEVEIIEHLADYLKSEQVMIAHYGETRGTNKFKGCDIVAICGILHKSEDHYIAKARAIYEQREEKLEDIRCINVGKVRRFNDNRIEAVKLLDMLSDYSQEIKRSCQRDNTRNVNGKVFIFHDDNLLLEHIGYKFPNCKFKEWYPQNLITTEIESKRNNPNQVMFIECFNSLIEQGLTEFFYHELREMMQDKKQSITDKAFSKLYNSNDMQDFIKAQGFVEEKVRKRKMLLKA